MIEKQNETVLVTRQEKKTCNKHMLKYTHRGKPQGIHDHLHMHEFQNAQNTNIC